MDINFVRGDMRGIEYEDEFDGVISWNASFGYFSDEVNVRVMELISRSMKSGAELILDLHNRDSYLRKYLGKKWRKNDDILTVEDWTFDIPSSRLKIYSFTIDISRARVNIKWAYRR